MSYMICTIIGFLLPIAAIAYSWLKKPAPVAWIVIVPCILFIFMGAVSHSGVLPIIGNSIHVEGNQHALISDESLYGSVIIVLSFILLVLTCSLNQREK